MCLINAMALFQIRFVTMLSHSEGFYSSHWSLTISEQIKGKKHYYFKGHVFFKVSLLCFTLCGNSGDEKRLSWYLRTF